MALFSTAYWAPVSYYQIAVQSGLVQIEQYEQYQKQSFRNRCRILSANGPLTLTVPVLRPHQVSVKDVRIDNSVPWRQKHIRAIEAAYRSSPFFEEYSGDVFTLYQRETTFLFDLNRRSWEIGLKLSGVTLSWTLSRGFASVEGKDEDYRYLIHPKKERRPEWPACKPYFQVFAKKWGFVPDLSILDLLFNEGGVF
ncbi:MAG: WbqC family protein [Bacteroidetes bacterium]|nr:WbqC family protein [Bacteroidota bacterium]